MLPKTDMKRHLEMYKDVELELGRTNEVLLFLVLIIMSFGLYNADCSLELNGTLHRRVCHPYWKAAPTSAEDALTECMKGD